MALIAGSCTTNKTQIAFLLPHLKNERYIKEEQYFTDKIAELGGEALVIDANNDPKVQINQAIDFLNKGVKVLVISAVNANLAAEIVRQAHNHNAKVIAYDRLINNSNPDYYISFKYEDIGYNMADYVLKLKPIGNYIIVGGDKTDFNAVQITKGQMKALENSVKAGKIKILYNVSIEEWNADNAKHEIDYFLNLSDITPDVIISSSDKMTGGILEALESHNLVGKVLLTGMDVEKTACRNMVAGKQAVSIYKPFKKLATTAAELAMNCSKDKVLEQQINDKMWNGFCNVPTLFIETFVIDKNNIRSKVIADGYFTEADIYSGK